jgi:hypothetical protein
MVSTIGRITHEIGAGLLLKAGIDPKFHYGNDIAARADSRYGKVGLTVIEACLELNAITGQPHPGSHYDLIDAAFSGVDGADLFLGVVGMALVEPFRAGDSTIGWVTEKEVVNFKDNVRIRREEVEQMKLLPRGGTAEHLGPKFAASETYRAHRFARQFSADSQDLVNDDVDALIEPARLFGKAALGLKRDLVYSILLANAALTDGDALFHANHSNLRTGSALSAANLDAAMSGMEVLSQNNQSVDADPRYLIVPPELRGLGLRLNRNMNNVLTVRSDSRLSNGVTDPVTGTLYAGSGTTWFLSATGGPIEFGYLESRLPEVRSHNLDKGEYGTNFDIVYDVGSAAVGFDGIQKNTA